eukprot:m.60802 g.60802  ORF g.60802 m.60802 type:complete len:266 (+) comp34945_c0_seq2:484-1281(+)
MEERALAVKRRFIYIQHLTVFNTGSIQNAPNRTKREVSPKCPTDRDLAIVIDGSGSVGRNHFKKALDVLGKLVSHSCGFQKDVIDCSSLRIAMVQYSTTAKVLFDFNDSKGRHSSQVNVLNDITQKPTYRGGATATGEALQLCLDHIFKEEHGMRRYGHKNVLLLTDGKSNVGRDPVPVAKKLNETLSNGQISTFSIIAVAIGRHINFTEINEITMNRDPSNPFVFYSKKYEKFLDIANSLLTLLTEGNNEKDACQISYYDKKRK